MNMPGQPNFTDIGTIVQKFKGSYPPQKVCAMIHKNIIQVANRVSFTDIGMVVKAFKVLPYDEAGPTFCVGGCD